VGLSARRDGQELRAPHALHSRRHAAGAAAAAGRWGSRQENSQHRLLTAAARHARFTKVPLSAVHTALQQDMSPGQARKACSSKAGAAELVAKVGDDLANRLAQLCLQQPRPPPPSAAASSSQPQQQVASPMQTKHVLSLGEPQDLPKPEKRPRSHRIFAKYSRFSRFCPKTARILLVSAAFKWKSAEKSP
jgi:hypothetical protein